MVAGVQSSGSGGGVGEAGKGRGGDAGQPPWGGGGAAPRVLRLLRARGLSRAAAERMEAVGRALRARTARTGIEYGATFEAGTGEAVGELLVGGGHDLDFSAHGRLLQADRRYASVHTHPASSPPSHHDAVALATTPPLSLLAVVGVDGTWYVVSRVPGQAQVDADRTAELFAAAFLIARREALRAQQARGWTDSHTRTAMLDALWRTVAPRLGLRYDRRQGNRPESP